MSETRLDANHGPLCNLYKSDVETWSLQHTYTLRINCQGVLGGILSIYMYIHGFETWITEIIVSGEKKHISTITTCVDTARREGQRRVVSVKWDLERLGMSMGGHVDRQIAIFKFSEGEPQNLYHPCENLNLKTGWVILGGNNCN